MIHYTHASRSGSARYVFELVRHVGEICGDVTLICPKDFQFRSELQSCGGVALRAVLPSPVSAEGRKFVLIARLLWQALCGALTVLKTRKSGHLVHVNFPGLMVLALPTLLLWRMMGIKVILTVHDVVPHRWLFPRAARRLESAILWGCYHAVNRLIVHHIGAQLQLVQEFGVLQQKISVIPHGAFSLDPEPLPLPPNGAQRVALMFGSLRENKGIHLAVQAVQQLRREGHAIALKICGSSCRSERQYWQSCTQLIASAPDGITAVDRYISDAELLDFIKGSHFVVLPYTEFHSQSGVAALAMSNGRPIIATQAGGLVDLVVPGKTGFMIAAPQVTDVKEALCAALRLSEQELRSMAERCSTFFRAKYCWSAIAAQHRALYKQVEPEASSRQLHSEKPRFHNR